MPGDGALDRGAIEEIKCDGGRTLAREIAQTLLRPPDSRNPMTLADHLWHGPAANHTCSTKDDDSHCLCFPKGQQFGSS